MLRRLQVVAVIVLAAALPAVAQHGGPHGGSMGHDNGAVSHGGRTFSGGEIGHGGFTAPAFRGSFNPTMRPVLPLNNPVLPPNNPVLPVSPLQWSRAGGMRQVRRADGSAWRSPYTGRRDWDRHRRRERFRGPSFSYFNFGVPYTVGWFGPDCTFFDCGYDDNFAYEEPSAPEPAPAPATDYAYPQPPVEQSEVAPADRFRPAYQPAPVVQELSPEAETPVTLVFKDGRPSEKIHNYMLTRTMLYVQEKPLRAIPVDELDLAATEKANREAGIDFQVPGAK